MEAGLRNILNFPMLNARNNGKGRDKKNGLFFKKQVIFPVTEVSSLSSFCLLNAASSKSSVYVRGRRNPAAGSC